MIVTNRATGVHIAHDVKEARTPWTRLIGLMMKRELRVYEGMYFSACNAIHTLGMRMQIDVVFLDGNGRICALLPEVGPGNPHIRCAEADSVLEMAAGFIAKSDLLIGDELNFLDAPVRL